MIPSRFTQSPDPVKPGDTVRFCYDISHCALPVTITCWFDPNGPETQHVITGEGDRCWEVEVPRDAEGGFLEDESMQSSDHPIGITP